MAAPDRIHELIERFKFNEASYRSHAYNETQLRREFLDPFFETLGWDVDNRQGHAEAYKDVIHEDAIKIGGATKAPDYCFRVGGARKFFLEAKKPAVNIKDDISPAFQLRRYAWSAKLPLSILSDFEEFAIYDCRTEPVKTDKAATARILYCRYTDYLDKWDEIAGVFSKDAILKGSFDKYAAGKNRRGTQEVDAAFLQEIESWRESLAKNLALRNPELSTRELNFAVQRTIDRIIFLRICEDRGIERYGQLQELLKGQDVYQALAVLFQHGDDRYNSGLFHFRKEKERPEPPDDLTLQLQLDDKPLKEILRKLYYPDSPYEFSVLPADILGQVYEQFLGKVIRLTAGHQAKVEEKPEVRKAGGVYYTPTYIVDYIVKQTVGKLCDGKTPKEVAKLRILDPACGSGSFLLGAYQFLLDWHLGWYTEHEPEKHARGKAPALRQSDKGEWRLTTGERKRILLNNIYGVDIDAQAVETTKLSLLLKVLEGETAEMFGQLRLIHERALPDLGHNIKSGNSLIGSDFYEQQQTSFLDEEESYRINAFDWAREFAEIMNGGGFDTVIGNPPYVVLGANLFDLSTIEYLSKFAVAQYKTDLFHLFIQRGIDLLAKQGRFGFIVPNPWLTMKFTDKLRKYILDAGVVREIVVFDHLVFAAADVYTALLFVEKETAQDGSLIRVVKSSEVGDLEKSSAQSAVLVPQQTWSKSEGYIFETRLVGETGSLVKKLQSAWPKLESVARASLGCQAYNSSKHTREQIENRVFHASHKVSQEYLAELAGNDVGRYEINKRRGEWIKYGPWLHDYRPMDWLQGPRLLVREIAGKPPHQIYCCYVEETYCNYKTILNINPSNDTDFSMKYLLGVINSRLLSFLYPYVSNKMVARGFPRISVGDLKQLPIRTINFNDASDRTRHDRMVTLVERMLTLHRQLAAAKTGPEQTQLQRQIEATDRQIDRLVYELYDLTEDEINIVESGAR